MGGSSKKVTVGYKYYLGEHMVLFHGPVDNITRIDVDERRAWQGEVGSGRININKPDLFGGEDREGGVSGAVDILPGTYDQGVNDYLAARLGSNTPAFRGVVSAVLRRVYLGMNPYLKPWSFRAQRILKRSDNTEQWYRSKAVIGYPLASASYFYETFSNGLGAYQLWNHPQQTVPSSFTEYDIQGGALLIKGSSQSGTVHPSIYRVLSVPAPLQRVTLDVKLVERKANDNGLIVLRDKNFNSVFGFNISRDISVDPNQYPRFAFVDQPGTLGYAVAEQQAEIDKWYTVVAEYDAGQGRFYIEMRERDSGTLVGSNSVVVGSRPDIRSVHFENDGGSTPSGSSLWDNVEVIVGDIQRDMNPAHIIRECLTDGVWGMGYTDADIDETTFQKAADRLYDERLGMSVLWDRQVPLEDFIQEVVRQADAVLRVNRRTGKFELILVRADYDKETLLTLDPSNVQKIEEFSRPSFGELVNSVTVNFWDAQTGKEGSLSVQDIALIATQGSVINTTVQYPGVTNQSIASRLAGRDLKTLSNPLLSCTLYTNQDARELNVGDVFKLTWPDYLVEDMVMRVTSIAYGDGRSKRIKIQAAQDIFDLPAAVMDEDQEDLWEDPSQPPTPASDRLIMEATYFDLIQRLGYTPLTQELSDIPELGYFLATAGKPSDGVINMNLRVDSGAGYEDVGVIDFCPTGKLSAPLGKFDTAAVLTDVVDGDLFEVGTWAYVGEELVEVEAWDVTTGDITLKRGLLDTIPAEHAAGTVLFFAETYADGDEVQYVDGDSVNVKLLPTSGAGMVDESAAPADTILMDARAVRPFRPANLRAFGQIEPDPDFFPTYPVQVTWVERNRLQETTTAYLSWTDGGVAAEAGTDYRVVVEAIDENGAVAGTVHDAYQSSTTFELTDAMVGSTWAVYPFMRVTVSSRRDGWLSWQSPSVQFRGPFREPTGVAGFYKPLTAPTGLVAVNVA